MFKKSVTSMMEMPSIRRVTGIVECLDNQRKCLMKGFKVFNEGFQMNIWERMSEEVLLHKRAVMHLFMMFSN